jgi:hypothetical protein
MGMGNGMSEDENVGAMATITTNRPGTAGMKGMGNTAITSGPGLEPGRVILGVLDASMVDYFREQVGYLGPAWLA